MEKISLLWHKIKETMADVFGLFYIRLLLIILFFLNIILWIFSVVINYVDNSKNNLLILHDNVIFGPNLIGSAKQIYIIPALNSIILFLNFIIILILSQYNIDKKLVNLILLYSALVVNIFLIINILILYITNF